MSTAIKINNYLNSFFKMNLESTDKELFNSIKDEFTRQQNHVELIASEI
jgi:glycine/serine hydroxymethyltransferase